MKGEPRRAAVAFVWHMHQPAYDDPTVGEPILPWARLHATGAYFDLAWLHARHPAMRSTVNFVPVLLDQLEACAGGRRDRFWHLSRKPARDLTRSERAFLLEHFFSVHHEQGVRARPRYWSLYNRRGAGVDAFSDADLRDLQALFNLAWFGAAARIEYPLLAAMEQKGQGFREDEKRKILDIQIATVRRVLDLYRALAAEGRVELTCTPYNHPILPLLIDSDHLARALPDAPRPPRFAYPEDAQTQVVRGRARHAEVFGRPAVGMWPAEGAVSPEACAVLAAAGAEWFATDEAQLFAALPPDTPRAALYHPYRLETAAGPLAAVFRDRSLSDLIGFTYAQNPTEVAVADLVARLKSIGRNTPADPALVVIALDGENPWEAYPGHGAPFLTALFAAIATDPDLEAVTVRAHLAAHPPTRTLSSIGSGSWINGDYGIWIGKPVENAAWRMLGEARRAAEAAPPEARAAALEHLYVAEGSDWFWWYGEPFQSDQDAEFDRLFRHRLSAAWAALGQVPPAELERPLALGRERLVHTAPRQLLSPRFAPGPSTFYEWVGAGRIGLLEGGAMHHVHPVLAALRYGFDLERLYLRLEPAEGGLVPERFEIGIGDQVVRVDPAGAAWLGDRALPAKAHAGIIELGVAFDALQVAPGGRLELSIRAMRGDICQARYPQAGTLDVTRPDAEYALRQWSA